jgi:hypothetical protein
MTKNDLWGGIALGLVTLTGGFASVAEAQETALDAKAKSNEQDTGETTADKDPMGWFGIGLKLGAGGNGEGELEVSGVKSTVNSRAGFQLAMPMNMGGDGFGWMIDPYLNFASMEGVGIDATTGLPVAKDYGITTFGAYTGPTINFHVMSPLYVGFGFGPKLGYSVSDAFDFGADIMARVPVTATYYLTNTVGLIGELGLGYGLTGYGAAPYVDPTSGQTVEPDANFGSAMTWDVSLGARFP